MLTKTRLSTIRNVEMEPRNVSQEASDKVNSHIVGSATAVEINLTHMLGTVGSRDWRFDQIKIIDIHNAAKNSNEIIATAKIAPQYPNTSSTSLEMVVMCLHLGVRKQLTNIFPERFAINVNAARTEMEAHPPLATA